MWRTLLARPAAVASAHSVVIHGRCYSLRSHKIHAVVNEHQRALEKDRDLILKVMGTLPSPREARQFLSKFSVPATASIPPSIAPSAPTATALSGSGTASPDKHSFIDTLLWPTDHVALIKLEGPFEKDSQTAIAGTLVQLQRLGLMSIVMLDNQTWWQPQGPSLERDTLNPSLNQFTETRRRMMKDMTDIVEEIERYGGHARPVYEGIFEASEPEQLHFDPVERTPDQGNIADHISIRPGLRPLESCLKLKQIPVMIPMATTTKSHRIPVQSNDALVALAKSMGSTAKGAHSIGASKGSLVPMRLIVINSSGGFPLTRTNGIEGPTHCFINLKDEYGTIIEDLENMDHLPKHLARSYRSDLEMIRESLDHLPPTCSALVTSSPSLTLITNLITDKPLFSSTMRGQDPKVMLATTVLRSGLDIFTYRNSLQGLDLQRLQGLLESSFGKLLDAEGYYARIGDRTRTVILAGQDYMGAAIVTKEGGEELQEPDVKSRKLASVAYLDKFSVAPKSQGIGVADILWKKLTDEFPDLVWRSRSDNPVNKWYFDRADGHIRIPGTNWTVFWYGPCGLELMSDYMHICRDIPASFRASYPVKK
ncbi:Amino-acid acetyltransferase, mitochondrial [Mortierella claussenii]|nr:Amino-acid acetyltransferase, mitochondrial [Mortierella claussenii]